MQNSVQQSGHHFLQVPGPTPIPERILAAMGRQMMDHRSPQFQELAHRVSSGIRTIFRTNGPVIMFPSSGTGALEAALVNTLSPGDCVLFAGTGQFDLLWATAARDLGLMPVVIQTDWRSGADADQVEEHLRADIGSRHQSRLRRSQRNFDGGQNTDRRDSCSHGCRLSSRAPFGGCRFVTRRDGLSP